MLVVGDLRERDLPPEVRREERVRFCDLPAQSHVSSASLSEVKEREKGTHGLEGRLEEVAHRRGRALGLRVAVLDARELQQPLARRRRDEARPARRRLGRARVRAGAAGAFAAVQAPSRGLAGAWAWGAHAARSEYAIGRGECEGGGFVAGAEGGGAGDAGEHL